MKSITAWIIFVSMFSNFGYSQGQELVFRIIAKNCKYNGINSNWSNYSTGFLYKKDGNTQGVITTLHGVCGCSSIIAERVNGNAITLEISEVDIDRDVALLTSNQLFSQYSTEGFEFSPLRYSPNDCSSLKSKVVTIYGYPFGRQLPAVHPEGRIGQTCTAILSSFITPDSLTGSSLSERGSPKLDRQMLNLIAEIAPGESGSPIIIEGTVVGIGNGGVGQGYAHTCWATPSKNIKLSADNINSSAYSNLELNNPNNLFLNTCNLNKPEQDGRVEICSCLGKGGVNGVTFWGPKGEPCNGISNWGTYCNDCNIVSKVGSGKGKGSVDGVTLWGPIGKAIGGFSTWGSYGDENVSVLSSSNIFCSCVGYGNILGGMELWGPSVKNCGGFPGWETYNRRCKRY